MAALGLAACGSSGNGGTPTGTSGSTTSSTATSTVPGRAQSVTDIKHAYSVLFNLSNPAVSPKLAAVQDGASLRAAMTTELKSPLAKLAKGAEVKSVSLLGASACQAETLPAPCAKVVYDILSAHSGKPLVRNAAGFAVYQAPTWKVAKATICTLISLGSGGTPSGC